MPKNLEESKNLCTRIFSWVEWDLKISKTSWNPPTYRNFWRFSRILKDSQEFSRILKDSQGFSRILKDILGFCPWQSNSGFIRQLYNLVIVSNISVFFSFLESSKEREKTKNKKERFLKYLVRLSDDNVDIDWPLTYQTAGGHLSIFIRDIEETGKASLASNRIPKLN